MVLRNSDSPNHDSDLLHLGCGLEAPADWLNVDGSFQATFARSPRLKKALVGLGIYPRAQAAIVWPRNVLRLDLCKGLPFANDRFRAIYSSHTFEHLYRDRAVALARECYRILRTGGVFRVVVPDLAAAVARYVVNARESKGEDCAADRLMDELMLQPRNQETGFLGLYHRFMNVHQHKWMYDGESLAALVCSAGFQNPFIYYERKGVLPDLERIENLSRIEGGAGVAVEVTKT